MRQVATAVVDDVRRRVQQDTPGHRGHKDDPLYQVRGLLRRAVEHLSDRQLDKLNACLIAGDPNCEVTLAWHAYQRLHAIYQAPDLAVGQRLAEDVITSLPNCPVPEIARLGRTLRAWRTHILARFEVAPAGAGRVSNDGTEAVNLLIEKTRRLAHGFRTFDHDRIRILLTASGNRSYRPRPNHT